VIARSSWEEPNACNQLASRHARRGRRRRALGVASAGSEGGSRQARRGEGQERDAHAEERHGSMWRQHLVEGGVAARRLLESRRRCQVVREGAGEHDGPLQRRRVLDERRTPGRLLTARRRRVLDVEGEREEELTGRGLWAVGGG